MKDLVKLEAIINHQVDYSDREAMERKMSDCLNVIGLSSKLKAKALGNLERKKSEVLRNYPDLNARLLKMTIDSQTVQEQEDYMLAERLNVGLFKTVDGLKSILSIQTGDEVKWS